MEYLIVDGLTIDPKKANELRQKMVKFRNDCIDAGAVDWAFILSINIAVLGDYVKRIGGEVDDVIHRTRPTDLGLHNG